MGVEDSGASPSPSAPLGKPRPPAAASGSLRARLIRPHTLRIPASEAALSPWPEMSQPPSWGGSRGKTPFLSSRQPFP